MLSRYLKTQHAQMNHRFQSMKQFASTKMYLDQYYIYIAVRYIYMYIYIYIYNF